MDRRQLTALLFVSLAFIFFMSDSWHRLVRKISGQPEPAPVSAPAKPGKLQDTASVRTPVLKGTDTTAAVRDTVRKDSSIKAAPIRSLFVRTAEMVVKLSSKGGRIEGIQLLTVKDHLGKSPWILPEERGGALSLKVGETELADAPFSVSDTADSVVVAAGQSRTITFTWEKGAQKLVRTYAFHGSSNEIGLGFQATNLGDDYRLSWKAGIRQIEPSGPKIPFGPPAFNQIVWKDVEEVSNYSDKKSKSISGQTSWLGLRSKYALAAVRFDSTRDGDADFDTVQNVDGTEGSYSWSFRGRMDNGQEKATLIVTPLEMSRLKALKGDFDKVLFTGYAWFLRADIWFPKLCEFILWMLTWLHGLVPNFGIAIIALTLLARTVLLPLTLKQTRQAKRMSTVMPLIKPKLEAIKEKYKDDMRKQQEETMKVYSEAGINPMASLAGCLPMLFQMPVFIGLYTVLGRAIELRGQPFFGWITDLSRSDVIYEGLKIPYIFGQGITVLPILMALSMYFLNKQTIKDPQQQMLVYVMPVMMLVFSGSMPSGLVLYWTISNIYSLTQTMLINAGSMPVVLTQAPAKPKPRKGK